MSKILFCIFYKKRFFDYDYYVLNCLSALKFYYPNAKILLCGDGLSLSDEQISGVELLLNDSDHNYFMQLDKARDYAATNGFEFIYLLPANIQFVRSPAVFLEKAVDELDKNNAISIITSNHLSDKVLPTYPTQQNWIVRDDDFLMGSEVFGFCHTGLIRLATLEKLPFRFGNATWKALNSWFLVNKMKAYSSMLAYSVTIPWVKVYDAKPVLNLDKNQFYLKANDAYQSNLDDWEKVCQFSDKSFAQGEKYWNSPEQYVQDLLVSNTFLYKSRRLIKWLLPKKWRYYLLMLCEG